MNPFLATEANFKYLVQLGCQISAANPGNRSAILATCLTFYRCPTLAMWWCYEATQLAWLTFRSQSTFSVTSLQNFRGSHIFVHFFHQHSPKARSCSTEWIIRAALFVVKWYRNFQDPWVFSAGTSFIDLNKCLIALLVLLSMSIAIWLITEAVKFSYHPCYQAEIASSTLI